MGAAAALVYPATLALLSGAFRDPRERATAIGVWSGVSGLAVALGPVSGGLLLEHFSWSSVFVVNVPLALLALVAGRRLLVESRSAEPGRFDLAGAVLSVAGVGLLVRTLIEAPGNGWASRTTVGGLTLAVALLVAFARLEARLAHPLLDVRLFTDRRFSAASGAIALAFFALFGFIFLITQYLQVVRGYGTLRAGVATLPFAIVTGALSPVAIVLMKRLGTTRVVAAGLALMSAGFVLAATTQARLGLLGPRRRRDGADSRRARAHDRPRDGRRHGRPAARPRRGRVGRERHHPRDRRHARRRRRRLGHELGLRPAGRRRAARPAPARTRRRRRPRVAGGRPDGGAAAPGPVAAQGVRAVQEAFMSGLHAGSFVAAGATAVAAIATLLLLPARHRAPVVDSLVPPPRPVSAVQTAPQAAEAV
ncbi:hypothetical protein GCM10025868_25950 [Angustibacter aerolatus]|uniref:Major facilitator superfamily (MFS) profile domain-containing protein n=1 Tax=Angustibacter aerolatus TaxID=1162965 RepID=A0ABQ6JGM6_9ACTN|nr:MFS transporter [Angustibacter aerolatus]GMA87345.1 hypothetical protein GCM10025868_25950 [Angustibacter aerolatus]